MCTTSNANHCHHDKSKRKYADFIRNEKKKITIHCCIPIWFRIVVTDKCQAIKIMDEDKNGRKGECSADKNDEYD